MNNKNFTEQLSKWVVDNYVIKDKKAKELACHAFLDTIPCIILGYNDPATKIVRNTANAFGTGKCSVIGGDIKLSSPNAAMINATAAHALDFDDNYLPAITHPSAVLIPALIAVAEENNISINNMIDAYIIGTEVEAIIGKFVNPKHYEKGWHNTSTIGTIGCAAACASLLNLNQEEIQNAISISVSMASGTKKQFGFSTKPYHAGMTAQNGITATCLAKNGLDACPEPITGDWGFNDLYNQDSSNYCEDLFNEKLAITTAGLLPKRFPCCGSIHRTIDGIIELMEENSINSKDIEKIETLIPELMYNNLKYNSPDTESEARFSMHYCVSVIVNTGKLTLSDFKLDAINNRKEIRDWMDKLKMSKYQVEMGKAPMTHHITIYLKNGNTYKRAISESKGGITKPFNCEDRKAKFYDCVSSYLNQEEQDKLYNNLYNLEDLKNIKDITDFF